MSAREAPARRLAEVTAVVLTLNEERHLPDCLASLRWCGRTLVLDSGSRDATPAIARRAGAELVEHPFENYSRQRQHALGLVDSPWLLFVDADERVTPELAAEIARRLPGCPEAAWWIPRRNLFFGRPLSGGGWWPDYQLRLLRPERCRYDPERAVHELAEVDGPIGWLEAPLVHINYERRREFAAKQRAYAALEARRRQAEGWRVRPRSFLLQPAREAWRRLIHLGGWRDGPLGLELALRMAVYELQVLGQLARLERERARHAR